MTSKKVNIVPLDENRIIFTQNFYSSIPSFTGFIKENALKLKKDGYCAPFIMLLDDTMVGYFTLSAFSIDYKGSGITDIMKYEGIPKLPSIMLGMLSISKNYEGKGLGSILLEYIFGKIKALRKDVGIRLIIVNAYDDKSKKWLKKRSFRMIPGKINKEKIRPFLYFDLGTIENQICL